MEIYTQEKILHKRKGCSKTEGILFKPKRFNGDLKGILHSREQNKPKMIKAMNL